MNTFWRWKNYKTGWYYDSKSLFEKCRLQYLMTNIMENTRQIDDASVKKISAPKEVETTMRTHAHLFIYFH